MNIDEDKVFGPLTARQLGIIVVAGSAAYAVYAYTALEGRLYIAAVLAALGIVFASRYKSPVMNESYIKAKRSKFTRIEDYRQWIDVKISAIDAQITFRAAKKLEPDPALTRAREMLLRIRGESN